jgi:hypothetical protein
VVSVLKKHSGVLLTVSFQHVLSSVIPGLTRNPVFQDDLDPVAAVIEAGSFSHTSLPTEWRRAPVAQPVAGSASAAGRRPLLF